MIFRVSALLCEADKLLSHYSHLTPFISPRHDPLLGAIDAGSSRAVAAFRPPTVRHRLQPTLLANHWYRGTETSDAKDKFNVDNGFLASNLHEGVAVPRRLTAGVPHYTLVLDLPNHESLYTSRAKLIALGVHAIPRCNPICIRTPPVASSTILGALHPSTIYAPIHPASHTRIATASQNHIQTTTAVPP
ncbi:hypothetical protein BD311DRAFT_802611 [Dichomitus squalens]|uniref:Uncharacterized protein n=1 Tax=Dichomitus squalens TaxID=114155 RepID=A0A4V2K1V9_9APHY|nr:hypothetical protein BD311DRAFT_802611 [Dichomitus squalens]